MTRTIQDNSTTELIAELARRVDEAIEHYCPSADGGEPARLAEAMRYSLRAGGKRIRPALVLLASQTCGGSLDDAMPAAVAIEMVHTFSLVHDDLPAMDNDDLRRGKPTNHKVFGEDMAILAGDGLLVRAFEILAAQPIPADRALGMVAELARASGPAGMTGGQVLDIRYQPRTGSVEEIERIHRLKTAAMIRGSVVLGGLAAGASPGQLDSLSRYGWSLGLAFQTVDDLLDVAGSADTVGKRLGKDAAAGKPNYAVLAGPRAAHARAAALIDEALAALDPFGSKADPLRQIARYILDRNR